MTRGARFQDLKALATGAGVTLCAFLFCGCATHVPRPELASLIASGKAPMVVDVRSGGEYEEDHVAGAVHIPFYTLPGHTDELPGVPEDYAVLYCEHGPRAGLGRIFLWLAGYGRVRFLEGHMKSWRADGLPMEYGLPERGDGVSRIRR